MAPVFSLIEDTIIKKLLSLYGIKYGEGIFTPGGSIATMYGMVLARYKKFPETKRLGMFNIRKPLVIFTSKESHYCITKGANWLGIGLDNIIEIETNALGQMPVEDLEKNVRRSISEGKEPYFVNATSGTTVLAAYDNLKEIGEICQKYGLWMHVDVCFHKFIDFSQYS